MVHSILMKLAGWTLPANHSLVVMDNETLDALVMAGEETPYTESRIGFDLTGRSEE